MVLVCVIITNRMTVLAFQTKSTGVVLYDAVINKLQLLEADYFDLQYNDSESIPVSIYSMWTQRMTVLLEMTLDDMFLTTYETSAQLRCFIILLFNFCKAPSVFNLQWYIWNYDRNLVITMVLVFRVGIITE